MVCDDMDNVCRGGVDGAAADVRDALGRGVDARDPPFDVENDLRAAEHDDGAAPGEGRDDFRSAAAGVATGAIRGDRAARANRSFNALQSAGVMFSTDSAVASPKSLAA